MARVKCDKCGYMNDADNAFACGLCGIKLPKKAEAAPAPAPAPTPAPTPTPAPAAKRVEASSSERRQASPAGLSPGMLRQVETIKGTLEEKQKALVEAVEKGQSVLQALTQAETVARAAEQ